MGSQPPEVTDELQTASSDVKRESLTYAELAARYGLRRANAQLTLRGYLRQLWDRRHFIFVYATSRNRSTYSNTALGQVWQVVTPLMNAAIYYVMFGLMLGGKGRIENYTAFLLTGIFIFTYTQRSVGNCSKSISGNLSLIRALHFPRASLPFAYIAQELQQLAVTMCVLFAVVFATREPVSFHWLLVPVALGLQTMFNVGAGLIAARLGSTFRDLNQLMPFIMRTWLYSSGVFFSIQEKVVLDVKFPQWVADVMYAINPAASFIELMRSILMESHTARPLVWHTGITWAVLSLLIGFWFFWKAEERYGRG